MNSQQEELGRKKINGEERKKWRGGEEKKENQSGNSM